MKLFALTLLAAMATSAHAIDVAGMDRQVRPLLVHQLRVRPVRLLPAGLPALPCHSLASGKP